MIRSNVHRMLLGACMVASSALACSALAQDRDDTKKAQSGYSTSQARTPTHDADEQNRMQGRTNQDTDDHGRALGRNARNDHDADDHARALGRNAGNNAQDRMQARNSDRDADDNATRRTTNGDRDGR